MTVICSRDFMKLFDCCYSARGITSLIVSLFQPFVLFSFSILIACSYCLVPSFNIPVETIQLGKKELTIHVSKLWAQYPQVWSVYDNRLMELSTNVEGFGTMADNFPAKLLVISVFTWAGSINWTITPLEFSTIRISYNIYSNV